MSDTTHLEERLAAAWHDGPPHPAVAERLVAGHRALRRQRVLTTAVTTFATVAVVGIAAAVTGGPGEPRTVQPATVTPTPGPSDEVRASASAAASSAAAAERLPKGEWAGYDSQGEVMLVADTRIIETFEDPDTGGDTVDSVAYDMTLDGVRRWYMLTLDKDGSSSVEWQPYGTYGARNLGEWVGFQLASDDSVTQGADPAGVRDWVTLTPEGRLAARREGVTVLRQVVGPDLADFAFPGDTSVAAALRVDGERWYVLARQVAGGGPADYFRTTAEQGGPTLDTFLDFARQKYSSGAGMR